MKKIILASAAVAAMSFGGGAMAATSCAGTGVDGLASVLPSTTGGDAVCDVKVTLDVNEQVTIQGLDDLDMGVYAAATAKPPVSAAADSDAFCIGSIGTPSVDVTFATTGTPTAANAFAMVGTTESDSVDYLVAFDPGTGTLAAINTASSVTILKTNLNNISCGNTHDQQLAVGYASGAFDDAEDTTYEDTITITVSPN